MSAWKNLKVRLDTWDRVSAMAAEQSRSVSAMADLLLRRALESVLGNSPSEHPSTGAPAPSRASAEEAGGGSGARTASHRSAPLARIEGQTTVEEMLASCPNCAGTFQTGDDGIERCEDCGYVRKPS